MKKLIINVFMASLLCLCTLGFVRAVEAQDQTITKERTAGDLVIETKKDGTTVYTFTITYTNNVGETDVIIKDTIPAEWNVTTINTVGDLDPVEDKDGNVVIYDTGDGNGTFTVLRSGKKSKGSKNKPNNSSTKICWIPPNSTSTYVLTVTVETRQSPSGKDKWAPTSCGLLVLNPGATAFEYDPIAEEIVLDTNGDPVVLAETPDPLELVAVADQDEPEDGVVPDGTGDEDGDTVSDADEVLIWGTDPCSPDSDGDGLNDNVEIDGPTDPLDSDTDDDGCNDGDDPNPIDQSDDADGDGIGADCDPEDDNPCVPNPEAGACP